MASWKSAEKKQGASHRASEAGTPEVAPSARKASPARKVTTAKPAGNGSTRRPEKAGPATVKMKDSPQPKAARKVADKATTKAAPHVAKATPGKDGGEKPKKIKLVRDSFTMPELEYELVAQVKKRCVANGLAVKKSEILRAAIASFAGLSDQAIGKAVAKLQPIKTGRPAKAAK